ncbi:hypothetical protein ABZP36_025990 [Zizania latifolia]
MEVDMEAESGGGEHGHKGADSEKAIEEPDSGGGDDTKRPREGVCLCSFEMEEDEYDDEPLPNPLDCYRRCWIISYGTDGDSFEDRVSIRNHPPGHHGHHLLLLVLN